MVEAARGLRDFSRANPLLVIKGGVVDGKAVSPAEIEKLADLESREVLLAKLAGGMKASMSKAAAVMAALPVQMAQLAEALRAKRESEGGAVAAEPAASAAPADGADQAGSADPAEGEADTAEGEATRPRADRPAGPNPAGRESRRHQKLNAVTEKKRNHQPWRSSAPTICSTRSRR